MLLRRENEPAQKWHMREAAYSYWMTLALERQISILSTERLLGEACRAGDAKTIHTYTAGGSVRWMNLSLTDHAGYSSAPSEGSSAAVTFESRLMLAWISAIRCLKLLPSTSSVFLRYLSVPSSVTSWRFLANFDKLLEA